MGVPGVSGAQGDRGNTGPKGNVGATGNRSFTTTHWSQSAIPFFSLIIWPSVLQVFKELQAIRDFPHFRQYCQEKEVLKDHGVFLDHMGLKDKWDHRAFLEMQVSCS